MEVLKRVDAGFFVTEICSELGISLAVFYKWRDKFGGMDVFVIARLKELAPESALLKKIYALSGSKRILNEALIKKWLGCLSDA